MSLRDDACDLHKQFSNIFVEFYTECTFGTQIILR